jgi:hypothetical protein
MSDPSTVARGPIAATRRVRASWGAWICFLLVLVASVAGVVRAGVVAVDVVWAVILLTYAFVGAFILQRRPANRIGWLLLVPGLGAIGPFVEPALVSPPGQVSIGFVLSLWVSNILWLPTFFAVILLVALFPTGRPIDHRWRWHTRLVLAMGWLLLTWALFSREVGPLEGDWTVVNPIGFLPTVDSAPWFMPLWNVGLATITVGALASMIVRFRRSDRIERQQLTWLLYAVSVFSLVYILLIGLNERVDTIVIDLLLWVALLFIPFALVMAILRYQLFDIDVIVRRTVVYAIVAALLAAAYVGSVMMFETFVRSILGVDSSVGVAASTLLVAALFSPVRRRTQLVVARRFFRAAYDAQTVATAFGTRARQLTDVTQLTDDLADVVMESLHPQRISVWLPGPTAPRGTH